MTKTKQVVLSNAKVLCPCCGYALIVGATVRLKGTRIIECQVPLPFELDSDQTSSVAQMLAAEEAERHG